MPEDHAFLIMHGAIPLRRGIFSSVMWRLGIILELNTFCLLAHLWWQCPSQENEKTSRRLGGSVYRRQVLERLSIYPEPPAAVFCSAGRKVPPWVLTNILLWCQTLTVGHGAQVGCGTAVCFAKSGYNLKLTLENSIVPGMMVRVYDPST